MTLTELACFWTSPEARPLRDCAGHEPDSCGRSPRESEVRVVDPKRLVDTIRVGLRAGVAPVGLRRTADAGGPRASPGAGARGRDRRVRCVGRSGCGGRRRRERQAQLGSHAALRQVGRRGCRARNRRDLGRHRDHDAEAPEPTSGQSVAAVTAPAGRLDTTPHLRRPGDDRAGGDCRGRGATTGSESELGRRSNRDCSHADGGGVDAAHSGRSEERSRARPAHDR